MENILNAIVTLFGILVIATVISLIIVVVCSYFNAERESNKEVYILIIVISIWIAFSMFESDKMLEQRNEDIKECIRSSNTIEELKETLIEKEIFEEI